MDRKTNAADHEGSDKNGVTYLTFPALDATGNRHSRVFHADGRRQRGLVFDHDFLLPAVIAGNMCWKIITEWQRLWVWIWKNGLNLADPHDEYPYCFGR